MSFLLDTSLISELVRKSPHLPVLEWIGAQDETSLYLSVVTIGELEKGIAKLPDSPRRIALQKWVRRELADRFRGRLLDVDASVATRWGTASGKSESSGRPIPVVDCLIAATSLQHGLTVVTRNTADLEQCGARCVNPWTGK